MGGNWVDPLLSDTFLVRGEFEILNALSGNNNNNGQTLHLNSYFYKKKIIDQEIYTHILCKNINAPKFPTPFALNIILIQSTSPSTRSCPNAKGMSHIKFDVQA